MSDAMKRYLHTVSEQIRWKRARPALTTELESHLLDEYHTCLARGMDEPAAEAEALRQMGDPVEIGTRLDRVHRPSPQWGLLLLAVGLAVIGGMLRISLGGNVTPPTVRRTVLFVGLSILALLAGYFFDYTRLARHTGLIYCGALLLALFSLWKSHHLNGVSYYTQYIVLLFPAVHALVVYRMKDQGWLGLGAAILSGIPLAAITVSIPSLLNTLLLLFSGWLLVLLSIWNGWFGVPRRWVFVPAFLLPFPGLAAWFAQSSYLQQRLSIALHPEQDAMGRGYLACTVREALSKAQWCGEGAFTAPYAQTADTLIPGGNTSHLLTRLVHYLGWLPFLLLCAALLGLVIWALVLCLRQKQTLGKLLSLSLVLPLGGRLAASLLANLGITLFSSTCPFLGGNLQCLVDMALMGVLLSIFRQVRLPLCINWPGHSFRLPRVRVSITLERA